MMVAPGESGADANLVIKAADFLERKPLLLELGCGGSKRNSEAIGIDQIEAPGVDIVGDAIEALGRIPDGAVSEIYSEHFLEHVPNAELLLKECSRVLTPGGRFTAVVPHFSNPYFYSDPTHSTFYGLYTFGYWVESTPWRRKVPHYRAPLPFSYVNATFVFKSSRPFIVRHALKKILTFWVNWSRSTKEFYEEMVSPLLGCYEVRYELIRLGRSSDKPE